MSDDPQKSTIPRLIEPRKFVQQGIRVHGEVPADQLVRLGHAVVSVDCVEAELSFQQVPQGEKTITGHVSASVEMTCQRCLEPVRQPLNSDVSLAVVWDEERARQLPEEYDPWIVSAEQADLYSIIEEELLLCLPLVAYHSGDCIDPKLLSVGPLQSDSDQKKISPFQVLEQLKGSSKN